MSEFRKPDRLLGIREVAERLGIHKVTIAKKIGQGPHRDPDFPKPIRSMGQRLKWRESQVEAYIAWHERRTREMEAA